jgi:hypothetical protein
MLPSIATEVTETLSSKGVVGVDMFCCVVDDGFFNFFLFLRIVTLSSRLLVPMMSPLMG